MPDETFFVDFGTPPLSAFSISFPLSDSFISQFQLEAAGQRLFVRPRFVRFFQPWKRAAMNLMKAIEARHSVRQYQSTPIPVNVREALQAEIDQANKEGDPQLKAAYDEPKAFSGMMALRQIQRRGQLHRMQRKAKPRPARTHWVFRRTRSASWRNMSNTAPRHSPALSNGVEPHSTR